MGRVETTPRNGGAGVPALLLGGGGGGGGGANYDWKYCIRKTCWLLLSF